MKPYQGLSWPIQWAVFQYYPHGSDEGGNVVKSPMLPKHNCQQANKRSFITLKPGVHVQPATRKQTLEKAH
jgi:hypothetical protein